MDRLYIQEYLNVLLFSFYSAELLIRVTALGIKFFLKGSYFNILDLFIVAFGMVDTVLSIVFIWGKDDIIINSTFITILRIFRLMRFFKLARYWVRFELLLETLGRTVTDMGAFSIFLFLFIYIYTILGLEFFQEKAKINSHD
jgi:hypothetical protein